jgi:hypothetical protein
MSTTEKNATIRRRIFTAAVLGLVALALCLSGLKLIGETADRTVTKGTDTMTPVASNAMQNRAIPSIDANAPQRIETATFALG